MDPMSQYVVTHIIIFKSDEVECYTFEHKNNLYCYKNVVVLLNIKLYFISHVLYILLIGSHSHSSSVKQLDGKEHSSSSNHVSDNHSMGYATSPRQVNLPSLPKPESLDNELIATYAETRIFASNIFMSGGSTSQLSHKRNSFVEDNS